MEGETTVLKLSKVLWNKSLGSNNNYAEDNMERKRKLSVDVSDYHCGKTDCGPNGCSKCSKSPGVNVICDQLLTPKIRPFGMEAFPLPSPRGIKYKSIDDGLQTGKMIKHIYKQYSAIPNSLRSTLVDHDDAEDDLSSIGSLTYQDVLTHLTALRIEHIQRLVRPLVQRLIQHPRNSNIFNHPVNAASEGLGPDYFAKVSSPMDLGTVKSRLQRGYYDSFSSSIDDINLIFKNAMSYNPPSHFVHQAAKLLKTDFAVDLEGLVEKCCKEAEKKLNHTCALCLGSCCLLCGEKCLKFEPSVLVCSGTCYQKVKKNSVYYVTVDGSMLWCQRCYCALPPVISNDSLGDQQLQKKSLLKRRSDEEVAEPWVQCDTCGHWVHQICSLYNDRHPCLGTADEEVAVKYECPLCKLENVGGKYLNTDQAGDTCVYDSKVFEEIMKPARAAVAWTKCKTTKKIASSTPKGTSVAAPELKKRGRQPKPVLAATTQQPQLARLKALTALDLLTACGRADSASRRLAGKSVTAAPPPPPCSVASELPSVDMLQADLINTPAAPLGPILPDAEHRTNVNDATVLFDLPQPSSTSPVILAQVTGSSESSSCSASLSHRLHHLVSSDSDSEFVQVKSQTYVPNDEMEIPENASHSDFETSSCDPQHAATADNDPLSSHSNKWRAASLPRTKLSDFIESMVAERLRCTGFEDAVATVTVRVVANSDQSTEVPDSIMHNMMTASGHCVPSSLPYRQKCILLFQCIDGVDVCLFCLYVQEYDDSCPAPNKSIVYIAYLDSVDYFRPMEARTLVYHEIMVAYLKTVQMRGFKQGHIWSCPPQRGDNFIFWCHPPHQRTPSRDRLNAWYKAMLLRCSQLGILSDVNNLWNRYLIQYMKKEKDESQQRLAAKNSYVNRLSGTVGSNEIINAPAVASGSSDVAVTATSGDVVPVCPPVFEGDFWVNEVLRLHRMAAVRSVGCDGTDISVNQKHARDIVKNIMVKQSAQIFNQPVDIVALHIPDYPSIITQPMDLGTVRDKLRAFAYPTFLHYAEDLRLVFRNAMTYNPPGHAVHVMASKLVADLQASLLEMVIECAGSAADLSNMDEHLAGYRLVSLTVAAAGSAGDDQSQSPRGGVRQRVARFQDDVNIITNTYSDDSYVAMDTCPVVSDPITVTPGGPSPSSTMTSHNDTVDNTRSKIPFQWSSSSLNTDDSGSPLHNGESPFTSTSCQMSSCDQEDYRTTSHDDNNDNDDDDDHRDDAEGVLERPRLKRSDSITSVVSNCSMSEMWTRRAFSSPAVSRHRHRTTTSASEAGAVAQDIPFEKPRLGFRGAMSVMSDLSKNVARLKDDLFVITFADPVLEMKAGAGLPQIAQWREDEEQLHSSSVSQSADIVKGTSSTAVVTVGDTAESQAASVGAGGRVTKAKPSLLTFFKQKPTAADMEPIAPHCLEIVADFVPDTSDPDPAMLSPFVDTRHTFLEMCQFRHYQFDSLRRAKHSSLMLLYHLQNPLAPHTRPSCHLCHCHIQGIRWHCDECANVDICSACYATGLPADISKHASKITASEAISSAHPHLLTPVHVSFV